MDHAPNTPREEADYDYPNTRAGRGRRWTTPRTTRLAKIAAVADDREDAVRALLVARRHLDDARIDKVPASRRWGGRASCSRTASHEWARRRTALSDEKRNPRNANDAARGSSMGSDAAVSPIEIRPRRLPSIGEMAALPPIDETKAAPPFD